MPLSESLCKSSNHNQEDHRSCCSSFSRTSLTCSTCDPLHGVTVSTCAPPSPAERVQFYQFITRPSLSNIKPALKQKIVRGGCPAECLMHPLERAWENPFLCCCNTRGRYSLSALVLVLSPSVSDFYLLKWISAQKHVYYLARGEL